MWFSHAFSFCTLAEWSVCCSFFRYYETSASTGQGVYEMFSGVLAAVVEAKLVKAKPVINAEQSSSKQK